MNNQLSIRYYQLMTSLTNFSVTMDIQQQLYSLPILPSPSLALHNCAMRGQDIHWTAAGLGGGIGHS